MYKKIGSFVMMSAASVRKLPDCPDSSAVIRAEGTKEKIGGNG
jgi:hypothetical protein